MHTEKSQPCESSISPSQLKTWALALSLAAGVLTCVNWFEDKRPGKRYRSADTPDLWFEKRRAASAAGKDGLIFVGSSRAMAGVRLQPFRQRWPGSVPIQLAINGASPLPVLEGLARDPGICGLVVVECCAGLITNLISEPEKIPRLREQQYRTQLGGSLAEKSSVGPRTQIDLTFMTTVFSRPTTAWLDFFYAVAPDPPKTPVRYVVTPERELLIDYSAADLRSLQSPERIASSIKQHQSDPAWLHEHYFSRVRNATAQIEARGGRVVIVDFPYGFAYRKLLHQEFPKNVFWTPLVQVSGALGIDCLDHPELAGFDCPDLSHLDQRDAEAFSAALGTVIETTLITAGDRRLDVWR